MMLENAAMLTEETNEDGPWMRTKKIVVSESSQTTWKGETELAYKETSLAASRAASIEAGAKRSF